MTALLVARRHALELLEQATPVLGKELDIFDALGGPVLVPAGHVVLRLLEVYQLVADRLAYEDGARVLFDD